MVVTPKCLEQGGVGSSAVWCARRVGRGCSAPSSRQLAANLLFRFGRLLSLLACIGLMILRLQECNITKD
jgi:hypothetical protein